MNRRALLTTMGTLTCSTLAGCTFGSNAVQAGTLIISNQQDQPHTVSISVLKTSEVDEDVPSRPHNAPGPTTTPLWQRDYSFEVSAGGTTREPELITEPGAFYVKVSLETGVTADNWLGLYPAGAEGEQIAESHVLVYIYEDGRLSVDTPVDD